jgi:hypothetical protein
VAPFLLARGDWDAGAETRPEAANAAIGGGELGWTQRASIKYRMPKGEGGRLSGIQLSIKTTLRNLQ